MVDAPKTTAQDIEKNKIMGVLAYLGILVLIPILAAKDSKFARYHANQGVILLLVEIGMYFIAVFMSFFLIGLLFFPLIFLISIVFTILGIINALQGQMKPLPGIGQYEIIKA